MSREERILDRSNICSRSWLKGRGKRELPALHTAALLGVRVHAPELPRQVHDGLAPRPPYRVEGLERRGDLFGAVDVREQAVEHGGVFERLRGAVAGEGEGGVRGVAEHGDAAAGVERRVVVVGGRPGGARVFGYHCSNGS